MRAIGPRRAHGALVPRPALGRRRRIVRERRPAVPRRAHAAVLAVLRLAHVGAGGLGNDC